MTKEELEQKTKEFINRINKESNGMWLNNYYLSDLLVMFATEVTKELQKENTALRHQLNKNPCVCNTEWHCNDCLEQHTKAKEIIRELLNYDIILIDSTRKFEYIDLQKKAEDFLDSEVEK
ncbi:MAG: hypothetical protein J6S67_07315 [Methanobrevibacter sp.]|nr:hypothetical protein [Methanobrevibacter sp.]